MALLLSQHIRTVSNDPEPMFFNANGNPTPEEKTRLLDRVHNRTVSNDPEPMFFNANGNPTPEEKTRLQIVKHTRIIPSFSDLHEQYRPDGQELKKPLIGARRKNRRTKRRHNKRKTHKRK